MQGWINVFDFGFDLYVKLDEIDQVWVVWKLIWDGIVIFLEFYDVFGKEVFYMFGECKFGEVE